METGSGVAMGVAVGTGAVAAGADVAVGVSAVAVGSGTAVGPDAVDVAAAPDSTNGNNARSVADRAAGAAGVAAEDAPHALAQAANANMALLRKNERRSREPGMNNPFKMNKRRHTTIVVCLRCIVTKRRCEWRLLFALLQNDIQKLEQHSLHTLAVAGRTRQHFDVFWQTQCET